MTNIVTKIEKTNLEKFYQGWHHFQSMNMGENFIVFKVPSFKMVPECIEKAKSRIDMLDLPLTVVEQRTFSNTFIVKEVAVW